MGPRRNIVWGNHTVTVERGRGKKREVRGRGRREGERHRDTKAKTDTLETHCQSTERWTGSHELCPSFCCCREREGSQPAKPREKRGGGAVRLQDPARASSAATGHQSQLGTPPPGPPWPALPSQASLGPSQGHFSCQCCLPIPFPSPLSQAIPYSSRLLRPCPLPTSDPHQETRQWGTVLWGRLGRDPVKEKEKIPASAWLVREGKTDIRALSP